ncbi:MAG: LytR C-terminal domain-containing protein [Patescibacteria group bacterium]
MKIVPTIVSVSRAGLSVCGAGTNGLLNMPFGAEVVKDLNVVGLVELAAQIKTFVETNKIVPTDLVVVLDGETYFEKQLTGKADDQMAVEVQEFVDSVPLASPSSKIFKVGDKYHVVVINRRLYESVRAAFEALGFAVKAVVPEMVLGSVGVGSTFDAIACRLILKKMAYVMENSFVGLAHVERDDSWVSKNKKTALTLAIGAVLVAVLGVGLIVWQTVQARQAAVVRAKARSARMAQVSPSPVSAPVVVATASAELADLSVRIVNASGVVGEAQKIKETLVQIGFSGDIEVGTLAVADRTLTVFSLRVSQEDRKKVMAIVGGSSQENTQTQFDVLITLGKNTP